MLSICLCLCLPFQAILLRLTCVQARVMKLPLRWAVNTSQGYKIRPPPKPDYGLSKLDVSSLRRIHLRSLLFRCLLLQCCLHSASASTSPTESHFWLKCYGLWISLIVSCGLVLFPVFMIYASEILYILNPVLECGLHISRRFREVLARKLLIFRRVYATLAVHTTLVTQPLAIYFIQRRYHRPCTISAICYNPSLWLQTQLTPARASYVNDRLHRHMRQLQWKSLVDWFWLTILPLVSSLFLVGCSLLPFPLELCSIICALIGIMWWLTLISRKLFDLTVGPRSRYSKTRPVFDDISLIVFFGRGCLEGAIFCGVCTALVFVTAAVVDWSAWSCGTTHSNCMSMLFQIVGTVRWASSFNLWSIPKHTKGFFRDVWKLHQDIDNEFLLRQDIDRLLGANDCGVWDWQSLVKQDSNWLTSSFEGSKNVLPQLDMIMVDPFPLEGLSGLTEGNTDVGKQYYGALQASGCYECFDMDVMHSVIRPSWRYR